MLTTRPPKPLRVNFTLRYVLLVSIPYFTVSRSDVTAGLHQFNLALNISLVFSLKFSKFKWKSVYPELFGGRGVLVDGNVDCETKSKIKHALYVFHVRALDSFMYLYRVIIKYLCT
jgi:hypothetical protein